MPPPWIYLVDRQQKITSIMEEYLLNTKLNPKFQERYFISTQAASLIGNEQWATPTSSTATRRRRGDYPIQLFWPKIPAFILKSVPIMVSIRAILTFTPKQQGDQCYRIRQTRITAIHNRLRQRVAVIERRKEIRRRSHHCWEWNIKSDSNIVSYSERDPEGYWPKDRFH